MAHLEITDDRVDVRLTLVEKVFALRGDYRFGRADVRGVEVFHDGLKAARGLRAPGLGLPGVRYIGTWRRRGGKQLVSVRRGQPAVRIELADAPYEAVLIGVDDPDRVRTALAG